MLKQLVEFARQLLLLTQDMQQSKSDLKEVRQSLKDLRQELKEVRQELKEARREPQDLTTVVQRLAFELRRIREDEKHEREKFALRLENRLLRAGRELPPGEDEGEEIKCWLPARIWMRKPARNKGVRRAHAAKTHLLRACFCNCVT